jgi:very-short-patch-repair endonuclease
VIEEARAGRNLVVQGPPGTGKSQTITNIIASAVHSGKTVLFVAEKTAALGVVYDRLRRAGLGTLCLEMHSRKANKREVLTSLEEALRFSGTSEIDVSFVSNLACCRDKLNRWSRTIHKPIGQTGRSAFDVIGRQLKLQADRVRLLDIRLDEAAEWSAATLSSVENALTRASEIVLRHRLIPKDHPWFGTNIATQSPFDLDRLVPKLRAAIAKLETLSRGLHKVFTHLAEDREPHIADAFATVKAFRHLASVSEETRYALIDPVWLVDLAAVENAIKDGERLTALTSEIDEHFRDEAWTCDTGALLLALRADGPSFLRRFSRRCREANANLRAICRSKPPKDLNDRIALLEKLQNAQQARCDFGKEEPVLSSALGPLWAELRTPWAAVKTLVTWVRSARSHLGGHRLLTLAAKTRDLEVFSKFAENLELLATEASSTFDDVHEHVRPDIQLLFGTSDYDRVPTAQLIQRVSSWLENSSTVNEWVEIRDTLSHLQAQGLEPIADRLMDGTIHAREARPITDLLISEALWRKAALENPEITSIDGDSRTAHVSEFRNLDKQRIKLASGEVIARYVAQRPNGYAGEMGIVRAEIDKKRGHRALRKLMTDAGSAIQRLKPVFLMSPLSVAQFIQPGRLSFDLLVIDEASQVAPEDALGVVARAKQIVVVGDHKQLPPTNFFKMVNAGDDDEEEHSSEEQVKLDTPTDFESILTLSRTRGMSERMLAWHYRSKHPSLIALSNEECYAGRLLLPPSPLMQTSEFGLSLVNTPRGHYDRGGTSRDLVQAEEVARAVAEHIRRHPDKSLGVACLSAQQRDAVYDMIDKLGIRSDVEGFTPKEERLFVKNLEAVQGDERDVIFISVGYGVAVNQSRPFLNFGPVSREGGERRLNVLASRAREKCVVFSSITAADIPADSEVRGTRMLRALLSFAETGKLGAGTLHGGGFDSPFEEAVARVIREAGCHVYSQVGVSSFRIDLGVIDPARPGEYILGVECDGATYHSARSARDRDRLRQEVLEGLGWRLHRIWSTDWFRNPRRESDKLLAAIKAAKDKKVARTVQVVADRDPPKSGKLKNGAESSDAGKVRINGTAVPFTTPYKECSLTVPRRHDLLDLSVTDIAPIALLVVDREGPVHTEEVARRIREAFGLQRTGGRILEHIRAGLDHLAQTGQIEQDDEFWSSTGRALQAIRDRRNASLPLRRAAMISPAEYQLAITRIISDAAAISREDLIIETARLFGFDRTGPDLREAIDRQSEILVDLGRFHLDGDVLRSGGSSMLQ